MTAAKTRAPLSADEIERIIEMRERRMSSRAIAVEIGCHEGSVDWALLREGVDIHQDRPLPPVPTQPVVMARGGHQVRRFTADEDRLLLLLEAGGCNPCQIARQLGRRHNSVVGQLRSLARRDARAEAQAGAS
jgi:DNA-binding CsgD family transcriptional regulator